MGGQVRGDDQKNFMVVGDKTHPKETGDFFRVCSERTDFAMILITQKVAESISGALSEYEATGQVVPTVVIIPSKEQPYDPRTDPIMMRVATFLPTAMADLGIEV